MPIITNLTLENFKSFRDDVVNFPLRSLNIVIGRNGSGKSNLIRFFEMMRRAADERLERTLVEMGGLEQVHHYSGDPIEDGVEWAFEFSGLQKVDNTHNNPNGSAMYRGVILAEPHDYTVAYEFYTRPPYDRSQKQYSFLETSFGNIEMLNETHFENKSGKNAEANYSEHELAIVQIRDKNRYPALDELREMLASWTIFRGFGSDALANIHRAQQLMPVSPLRLEPFGTNLLSVLYALKNTARYRNTYKELLETLRAAIPDFIDIDLPVVGGGMISLNYSSKYFGEDRAIPASSMSDGQLRFLGLAVLLSLPEPPPLIAIDEPEIGLHPEMLPLLAGLLKEASKRTQIIVATHSPQLLSAEDITADDVIIAERENGSTKLERLSSERLAKWLERYSLGELWTRGTLDALVK